MVSFADSAVKTLPCQNQKLISPYALFLWVISKLFTNKNQASLALAAFKSYEKHKAVCAAGLMLGRFALEPNFGVSPFIFFFFFFLNQILVRLKHTEND